jgi:hypothetical protein
VPVLVTEVKGMGLVKETDWVMVMVMGWGWVMDWVMARGWA